MKFPSNSTNPWRLIVCCVLLATAATAEDGVNEAEGGADDAAREEAATEVNCIRRASIRSTDIVDDRTIIFNMSQQQFYVNELPNRCFGLRNARTFSYRVTGSQLCNVDTIRVVRSLGGRPDTGPACGLGMFRPVSKEEVEALKNRDRDAPDEETVPDEAEPGDDAGTPAEPPAE